MSTNVHHLENDNTRVELDASEIYAHHDRYDEEAVLNKIRTAGGISISPEKFEKIYLSPKSSIPNKLRETWGNPIPL